MGPMTVERKGLLSIEEGARIIRQGGVVAYPTEGVFGLGCDPFQWSAVERILKLKGRSTEKGLILLASDFSMVEPWVEPLNPELRSQVLGTWPGPVTWLMPAHPELPAWIRGSHDTVAVRVTSHPVASALSQAASMPIVSTSANPSGQEPLRTAQAIQGHFFSGLDGIVEGVLGMLEGPTEIRDALTGRVIRTGGRTR